MITIFIFLYIFGKILLLLFFCKSYLLVGEDVARFLVKFHRFFHETFENPISFRLLLAKDFINQIAI